MAKKCQPLFMSACREIGDKQITGVFPVYCGSWDCERCRRKKGYKVRNFIKARFSNKQLYMITLTFKRNLSPEKTWEEMGKCWNRLRTTLSKHTQNLRYIRIVEPHKRGGYPHFHVLTDTYIPAEVLTRNVTKAGFGFIMHRTRMSTAGAEVYVSKYLTKEWNNKEAEEFRRKTGARIISASQSLGPVFSSPSYWTGIDVYLTPMTQREANAYTVQLLRKQGHTGIRIQKEDHGILILSHPPDIYKPAHLQSDGELWDEIHQRLEHTNKNHKLYS